MSQNGTVIVLPQFLAHPEFGFVRALPTGLAIDPRLPEEEWQMLAKDGAAHYEITGKAHFQATTALVDLLAHGDAHFHDTYGDAIDATREYMRQHSSELQRWTNTLKKIAPERRRINLTLSHHDEVASLSPELQDKYLQLAEDEGMTTRELRARIRAEQEPKKKRSPAAGKDEEEDDEESIEQKLIDISNWLSSNSVDDLTAKMKEPMHKIYNAYRRRWIAK